MIPTPFVSLRSTFPPDRGNRPHRPAGGHMGPPLRNFGPFLPVGADLCVRPKRTGRSPPHPSRPSAVPPSPQGEGKGRAGSRPRPASSRPKSRRFAAVGLETRLRAQSWPFGPIHLLAPYTGVRCLARPLIRPCRPPSPLWGEGFAGGHMGPPLRKFRPVAARRGGPACPPKTNRSVAPSSGPVGHLPPRGKVKGRRGRRPLQVIAGGRADT